jgi:O-acetylserine/cysteine efflux transporter
VFFTIALAMRVGRERLQPFQWFALLLAVAGITVIVLHTDGSTTPLGLGMALFAALCWGGGNTASRQAGKINMLAYVVWSSLFAAPPLLLLSLVFEGSSAWWSSLQQADLPSWLAVAWQAWGNSLFGYAVWGWLLARHPAATITPMALLVPVFGMGASAWWLGEPLPVWKLEAAALVMLGLVLNVLWPRFTARNP